MKLKLSNVLSNRATYDFLITIRALNSEFSLFYKVNIKNRLKKKEALSTLYNIIKRY
jgi:hypothetical protein